MTEQNIKDLARDQIADMGDIHAFCYFCKENAPDKKPAIARYDFQMVTGQWAYGCYIHYLMYRAHTTLGTGKGQRLVYSTDTKDGGN